MMMMIRAMMTRARSRLSSSGPRTPRRPKMSSWPQLEKAAVKVDSKVPSQPGSHLGASRSARLEARETKLTTEAGVPRGQLVTVIGLPET
jgi:hypothetical protein